jgi:hypothetical protein
MDGAPPDRAVTLWTFFFLGVGSVCLVVVSVGVAAGAYLFVRWRRKTRGE